MPAPSNRVKGPVAVAVSGGADSLAALIRYKEQGLPVIALHGVFGQYLDPANPGQGAPGRDLAFQPSPKTRLVEPASLADPVVDRLAETCASLDIPFFVADCSGPFLNKVITAFVQAYARGKTPNPCAVCNAEIKFGLLLDLARSLGAQHLSTGHYARLRHDDQGPALFQGADPVKDQSYFLCLVPKEALARALFPLGDSLKASVVEDLAKRNIPVPQSVESQEICFVPDSEYRSFLAKTAPALGLRLPGPGPVILPDLRQIGMHEGLWQYTEGQRRGLGIAWDSPLYVITKDMASNSLVVGTRQDMHCWGCVCQEANCLVEPENWPEEVLVKTRYRQKAVPAFVRAEREGEKISLRITFAQVEQAVAPGQIAAIYVQEEGMREEDGRPVLRLLGGGGITSVHRD